MPSGKQPKQGQGEEDPISTPLIACADLILPWLNPQELASVASNCKSLAQLTRLITTRRSADASRSMEKLPIPFDSAAACQGRPPYAYFLYAPSQLLSPQSPDRRQPWGSPTSHADESATQETANVCGCGCQGCGTGDASPGVKELEAGVLSECGPSCDCGLGCKNRSTQRGVNVKVKIVWDDRKGWGLFADQMIPRRQFICEYAGELLTTKEARRRQQDYDQRGRSAAALLVVREHLPSGKACLRVNIDATKVGNVARFINHSCDGGNLWTAVVRSPGACLPRLCFFARRDIEVGEELGFSYGETRGRSNGLQCFCGTSACCGTLPSELT